MLNIYHLEPEGIKGYGEQFLKIVPSSLIEGSECACNGQHRGLFVDGVSLSLCGRNSAPDFFPRKGCGPYANKAADVVHPSGVAVLREVE